MPEHGERLCELNVGPVRVVVRYSCARRDLYELSAPAPLPGDLRERMAALGELKGTEALYVVDMAGSQQMDNGVPFG